jgi:ribosomal protein S18 acetylase RimI-like enzyme
VSTWGLAEAAFERTAVAHPPLPDLWKDYQGWHHDVHGPDADYRPEHSVQSWGNVEEYLNDRHGLSPHDPASLDHPAALGMAKLHSLAQARPQVDGFGGTDDYLLNDDDLTTGAALGLLRIRKNQLTQKLEPALPRYQASRTAGQYHPDYNIVSYPATESGHENIVAHDHEGNLAGFINVSPTPFGERYVSGLSVQPEHQRKGLGTALWEAAGRPLHDPQEQSNAGAAWAKSVGGGDRRYE